MSSFSLVNTEHSSIPTPAVGKTQIAVDDTGALVTKNADGVVNPVGMYVAKRTFNANEIRASYSNPVVFLDAPGEGKTILMTFYAAIYQYADDVFYDADTLTYIGLTYDVENADIAVPALLFGDANLYNQGFVSGFAIGDGSSTWADMTNKAILLKTTGEEITNEAANGTLTIILYYSVIDLT